MGPLAAAPVPTYDQAYGSLGSVYDPQVASAQATLAPQMSALDQAKVNAFKDIGAAANAKGMTFSGFTPDQEATYTGTKYLPAVANLHASITDAVNKLNAARANQAQDIVYKGQQAANDAAYKNMELALSQQRNAIAASRASGSGGLTAYEQAQLAHQAAVDAANSQKDFNNNYGIAQDKNGNYQFSYQPTNSNNSAKSLTLAQYAQAGGFGTKDVLNLLKSGSAYDKNVYSKVKNLSGDALGTALSKYKVYGSF